MPELQNPNLPFVTGDQIGSGETRDVYKHPDSPVVTKVYKENPPTHPGSYTALELENLIQQVGNDKAQIEFVRQQLIQMGGHSDTVPDSGFVIHASGQGEPTFSEVQPEIKGKTLEEDTAALWQIPKKSLDELIHIFELNNRLLDEGMALDIVGGTGEKQPKVSKALSRLFPLLTSRNIMIDDAKNVRYVDPKVFTKEYLQSPASGGAMNKVISRIGSETSIVFLKTLRMLR